MPTPRNVPNNRGTSLAVLAAIALLCLGAGVLAQSQKLAISPMGNSITGSFDNRASYRYYVWQTLVDSGFAVKGQEKVDFVGWYCGVDDQGSPGACGDPKYDSTTWDWDHDGLHAAPASWLPVDIAPTSCRHVVNDLGYPGHHIVMLHIGSNDVLNLWSLAAAKASVGRAIDTLRSYNPNVIVLLAQIIPGISPYGYDISDSFPVLNTYYEELQAEMTQPNSPIYLVDQYTGYDPRRMNGLDGIHPLDTGERWIARNFQNVLVPILQEIADPPTVTIDGSLRVAGRKWQSTHFNGVVSSNVTTVYPDRGIASVGLYLGDTYVGAGTQVNDSTYSFSYMPRDSGTLNLTVQAVDYCHRTVSSDTLQVVVPYNNTPLDFAVARIQGNGATTPFPGWRARIRGVVTHVKPDSSAFWVQNRDADAYQRTSDGIKVLVESCGGPVDVPATGDSVMVVGIIAEVTQGAGGDPVTCLVLPDTVSLLLCGGPSVDNFEITHMPPDCDDVSAAKAEIESREGMMVSLSDAIVVGPTTEENLAAVLIPRSRWPGSGYLGFGRLWTNESSPGCVDYNTERLFVDFSDLPAVPMVHVWDTIRQVSGVVDCIDGVYRVVVPHADSVDIGYRAAVTAPVSERRYPESGSNILVTTIDFGGVYDTIDDGYELEEVVTADAYAIRMAKLRRAVIDEMLEPNILAVQGVEKPAILAELADAVNQATGATYKSVAYETQDARGLDCGFLYDTTEFELVDSYLLNTALIDTAFTSGAGIVPCGAPLLGRFRRNWLMMNLISVELVGRDTRTPLLGSQVPFLRPHETQRQNQALAIRDFVNDFVDESQWEFSKIGVLGNLNDLRFTEDTEGATAFEILGGTGGEVILTDIVDLSRPTTGWFSDNVDGNTELLTAMMLSPLLMDWVGQVDLLHFNSPFAAGAESDSTSAIRSAESDAVEFRW